MAILAALLIATAAFVVIGIGNAMDPPEPGSVYQKEGAVGMLLVLGSTLPLAIAFRYPMIALVVIMASFTAHAGLNHDVIWVVQFTALLSAFMAITRGGNRQSLLVLLLVYIGVVVTFGIFREEERVGNVLVQILLFGGLWIKTLGRASGIKMCYAAMTKGTTALHAELLIAAEKLGLTKELMAEFAGSQPAVVKRMEGWMPTMPAKSRRWVSEMEEIEATFRDLGLTPNIFKGVADMYRMIGDTPLGDENPESRDTERGLAETIRLIAEATGG